MATALDEYADMEPSWGYPVVIESHTNGVRSKEMNSNTPVSHDEIAEDAIRCWEAGLAPYTRTTPASTCSVKTPTRTT